jgi:hypothetical protein
MKSVGPSRIDLHQMLDAGITHHGAENTFSRGRAANIAHTNEKDLGHDFN